MTNKFTPTLWLIPSALHNGYENLPADYYIYNLPLNVQHVACSLKYWLAENLKTARLFLKSLNIPLKYPLKEQIMLEINDNKSYKDFINRAMLEKQDIGVLSEAGMPAIADPGSQVVELAHQMGLTIKPLAGPCSIILALMSSGLNGQSFVFHGYLPINIVEKLKFIQKSQINSLNFNQTQICIETPYRNVNFAHSLIDNLNLSTKLCIACELTLPSQKIYSYTIKQWKNNLDILPQLNKKPCLFLWLASK